MDTYRTAAALLALLPACARGVPVAAPASSVVSAVPGDPIKPEGSGPTGAVPSGPPLVVSVVIDQLGSDTLLRSLQLLPEEGLIRMLLQRGSYYERSDYEFANTLTAPGHAAIFTGAPPRVSGVSVNDLWDPEQQALVQAVSDRRYAVHGSDGKRFAGPGRLRAETVAERLKAETQGRARVVSVSLKDRAAVFSVGRGADVALWFDSHQLRFTSSTYSVPALPDWVNKFHAANPVTLLFGTWHPLNPEVYAEHLGPDRRAGEGGPDGVGASFPHEISSKYPGRLRFAPQTSEYLVALAQAASTHYQLGQDGVPDLLSISISGTDYAGHTFGPRSWEYLDHLIRVDKALGRLIRGLEGRTKLAVLLTSDHGAARVPETVTEAGAGRLLQRRFRDQLEHILSHEFGAGPWVQAFKGPFLYLTEKANQHARRGQVLRRVVEELRSQHAVLDAFLTADAVHWHEQKDPLKRAAALSIPPDSLAQVMVLLKPRFIVDRGSPAGFGTHHGSPHDYDRIVPVLVMGPGVPARRVRTKVSQLRVAATLAQLLGVAPPKHAERPSLLATGVMAESSE